MAILSGLISPAGGLSASLSSSGRVTAGVSSVPTTMGGTLSADQDLNAGLSSEGRMSAEFVKHVSATVIDNYEDLADKPKIEGVTLIGNKTFEELTLCRITNTEIENMLT